MNADKLRALFENSTDKYADAKLIGTTYQTMYNIIYKGSVCKVDLLQKIAKFYNVPVGYFFDEESQDDLSIELDKCKKEIERLTNIIDSEKKGASGVFLALPLDDDEFIDLREMKDKIIKVLKK